MENSSRTMLYRSFLRPTLFHLLAYSILACFLLSPFLVLKVPSYQQYAYASSQQTNLSNSGNSDFSRIGTSGNNVYVVWSNLTSNQLEFKASSNNGGSFGSTIEITNSSNQVFGQFSLAAASSPSQGVPTNNVYIVWSDAYQNTGNHAILLARSTDGGNAFEPAINLSNDSGDSF